MFRHIMCVFLFASYLSPCLAMDHENHATDSKQTQVAEHTMWFHNATAAKMAVKFYPPKARLLFHSMSIEPVKSDGSIELQDEEVTSVLISLNCSNGVKDSGKVAIPLHSNDIYVIQLFNQNVHISITYHEEKGFPVKIEIMDQEVIKKM